MLDNQPDLIHKIRKAARNLIRELGLLNKTLAGTDLSVSYVHALVDIGNAGSLTAKELSENLLLEKSTVSRLVKKLILRGEIIETVSLSDNRQKDLWLTEQGKVTVREISNFAEIQVDNAISPLNKSTRNEVLKGLEIYSNALKHSRLSKPYTEKRDKLGKVQIIEGYSPGLLGRIVEMHATYYSQFANFDAVFETTVANGLSDFIPRLSHDRNIILHAVSDDQIVGSIAIDGQDLGKNISHLRWFIVDKKMRGSGLGKELFSHALKFCDKQGFDETHLWTFKGLNVARKLYEQENFTLVDEYIGDQWGRQVLEQKFVRPSP
ncbi:bifunctional helix-turn-helix transcriptional regulator/GNAT family N-acetyltransferase [Kiloniella antarctica]|uniref:GNAT family N-acetyltransferase n=1 Tax=Kiloniella antarctica TaxID=1550907 RepID=A0ABW5BQB4_9PROT